MSASPRPTPDPDGLAYARYWEPVLAAAGSRLLSRVEGVPADFLDLGTGTGSLAFMAARRWPATRIVGLDASGAMLSVARHRAAAEWPDGPERIEWVVADAAHLPIDSASFDAVTSAFMVQLVDDRAAVLREILRVLRPGGTVALLTWAADDLENEADLAFDEVVRELGLDEPIDIDDGRTTDYEDTDEPRRELAAAGFDAIESGSDELTFRWSRDDYLEFKQRYDERESFESLAAGDRERLASELAARWSTLPDAAFTLRAGLVWATARRPEEG